MSVAICAFTIVVRDDRFQLLPPIEKGELLSRFRGRTQGGLTYWRAMSASDVAAFTRRLGASGLTGPRYGPSADVALLEQLRGLLAPCSWLAVEGGVTQPQRVRLSEEWDVAGEHMPRTVSVCWDGAPHSVCLSAGRWRQIIVGSPFEARGSGYWYEGEFFWDYWRFNVGGSRQLIVQYGDDGVGFDGLLVDAHVERRNDTVVIL